MRRVFKVLFLLCSVFVLMACEGSKYDQDSVKLLYSKSYGNVNDFDQPVIYIDNYSAYLDSGYPLNLEAAFFDDKVLYTYAFQNGSLGSGLFVFKSFLIDDDNRLVISYETRSGTIISSPAFGPYAMIFEIDKSLYDGVDGVIVQRDSVD